MLLRDRYILFLLLILYNFVEFSSQPTSPATICVCSELPDGQRKLRSGTKNKPSAQNQYAPLIVRCYIHADTLVYKQLCTLNGSKLVYYIIFILKLCEYVLVASMLSSFTPTSIC